MFNPLRITSCSTTSFTYRITEEGTTKFEDRVIKEIRKRSKICYRGRSPEFSDSLHSNTTEQSRLLHIVR
jgi:hypothetical protein